MQSRNKFKRIVCIALAVIMTLSLVSTALILMVNAASSKEIEKELVDLRAQQAELKKQSDALKAEINQNEAETQTLIEKKADIDKQMDMSRQTIENLNAQIQQYSPVSYTHLDVYKRQLQFLPGRMRAAAFFHAIHSLQLQSYRK